MATLNQFTKDPSAVLDYTTDWSQWLLTGDTIASATVVATAGISVNSFSNTTTSVSAWLAGGTSGVPYQVTFGVVTAQGRTDERSITVNVANR